MSNYERDVPVIIYAGRSRNNFIGMNGTLPWLAAGERLKGDLPMLKRVTTGNGNNAVICGTATAISMGEFFPMEGRYNCVLSKSGSYTPPENVNVFPSTEDAIEHCKSLDWIENIFILGGRRPFEDGLSGLATHMILIETFKDYEGDVEFPDFDEMVWNVTDTKSFANNGWVARFHTRMGSKFYEPLSRILMN